MGGGGAARCVLSRAPSQMRGRQGPLPSSSTTTTFWGRSRYLAGPHSGTAPGRCSRRFSPPRRYEYLSAPWRGRCSNRRTTKGRLKPWTGPRSEGRSPEAGERRCWGGTLSGGAELSDTPGPLGAAGKSRKTTPSCRRRPNTATGSERKRESASERKGGGASRDAGDVTSSQASRAETVVVSRTGGGGAKRERVHSRPGPGLVRVAVFLRGGCASLLIGREVVLVA